MCGTSPASPSAGPTARFAFWNCVTLTDVGADAELLGRRLVQVADIMRAKRHPGFLWLFEDLLADDARAVLDAAAERAGLHHAFPGTGMAGDLLPVPEPTHPDLTFVRVTHRRTPASRTRTSTPARTGSPWRTAVTGSPVPRCGRRRYTLTWACGTVFR